MQYGLMIDNEFCTGCHSCEIACKNEHDLPMGQFGVKVLQMGPWEMMGGKQWEYRYIPVPTKYCDLCASRTAEGQLPTCAFHCPADVIEYGPLDQLAQKLDEKGQQASIFIP